jgi:hypothetical protein
MAEPESIKEVIGRMDDSQSEGGFEEIKEAGSLKRKGGARVGAGRPKGATSLKNRTKQEAQTRFVERVQANVDNLFNAQLSLATGEQHLFVKYHVGEGKDRRAYVDIVTDPDTIAEYLTDYGQSLNRESDDEYYYIATKPANNQAIDSLLNRAFGKAPEKIEIEGGFFKANSLKIEIVKPTHDLTEVIEGEEVETKENGTETDTNDSDAKT